MPDSERSGHERLVVAAGGGLTPVAGDKQGNLIAGNVSDWSVARRFSIPRDSFP